MDSASPTGTSASANRGGRPKDWTDPRSRRLVRLYVYTRLPFDTAIKLVGDGVWKPGKDAANKVKNSLLGNDPRWLRPKDDEEEKNRISALRNSIRSKHCPRKQASNKNRNQTDPTFSVSQQDKEDASLDGSIMSTSCRQSVDKVDDFVTFNHQAQRPRLGFFNCYERFRQDTGLTNSTDISMTSTIRETLSSVSKAQAKNALRVLKQYTFPVNADSERSRATSPHPCQSTKPHTVPDDIFSSDTSTSYDELNPGYLLPGDLVGSEFMVRTSQCPVSLQCHGAKRCWCSVASEVAPVQAVWSSLGDLFDIYNQNLVVRDSFGNTIFHHMAATEGISESFLYFVHKALDQPLLSLSIHYKNTAGQTFLHVLHRSWFQPGSPLNDLLNTMKNANFDILATDAYGRNFYHLLRRHLKGAARFPGIPFELNQLNRRDAFNTRPMDQRLPETSTSAADALTIPHDAEFHRHKKLLTIVTDAINVDEPTHRRDPLSEDALGRNGLQCLAEADLEMATPTKRKRKLSEVDEPRSQTADRDSRRLDFLRGLITARVDVNHYDRQGLTPLMAFVRHGRDESRWDKEDTEKMVRELVAAGARLEARNSQGETALHLAARYGRQLALRVLLDLGANPRVRNANGLSILQTLDEIYLSGISDGQGMARVEACRAILTSHSNRGAIQEPTIFDEWSMKNGH
ncbi:hypothetical protein F5Y15DRAFT_149691 [Xylariaceae sp. FL0016]|nr:hypothetical protein F5Y15DRAFT_149691 [Xylariaceae sp. FL0016]